MKPVMVGREHDLMMSLNQTLVWPSQGFTIVMASKLSRLRHPSRTTMMATTVSLSDKMWRDDETRDGRA